MNKHHQALFLGRPVRIPKALRDELEAAIQAHLEAVEKLTAVLDRADGDLDLEPNLGHQPHGQPLAMIDSEQDAGDEPEFTWHETHGAGAAGDSCQDEDAEPSLAHTNDLNQEVARARLMPTNFGSTWVQRDCDLEAEHRGREPDADGKAPHVPPVMP